MLGIPRNFREISTVGGQLGTEGRRDLGRVRVRVWILTGVQ